MLSDDGLWHGWEGEGFGVVRWLDCGGERAAATRRHKGSSVSMEGGQIRSMG